MKYGLIGEHLKHSFSKEIHNYLADYEYELCEIPKEEFDSFANEPDFCGINVTIPYKELIIPHLYFTEENAKKIGAVNTVVNRCGKLYGYNTDFYGMKMLISHAGVSVSGKKVAILGTGGTSKTALAVAKSLGAKETLRVSRSKKCGTVSYSELYENHRDTEVIINTTPVGMFPDIFGLALDISHFDKLSGVIDAVYNPLRSPLVLSAKKRKIAAEGGLYMLVAQAVRASEIFLDKSYGEDTTTEAYKKLLTKKENVVLVGMPSSGKSTVGKILAKAMCRELIDTDELIKERCGKSIPEIFKSEGERYFRDLEAEVIRDISCRNGVIISTGGGAVLRSENVDALRENGRIYFIDRPLDALIPTKDRPLSSTREAVTKIYEERYEIYKSAADVTVDADCSADKVAEKIKGSFGI